MKIRQGILLAAGTGSRLLPLTTTMNKHMIPVYNRHMIEYPIETLKQLGCETVTIVIGGDQTGFGQIISYLKDGESFGMKFNYVYQTKPSGIAQAIQLCEDYIKDDKFAVILGDNVYEKRVNFTNPTPGAQIVLCQHPEINRFGVASILNGTIVDIVEKPKVINEDCDNFAITGLYVFDQKYFKYFEQLSPSARGEYEITDMMKIYHADHDLYYVVSNGWWSDTGTFESIQSVSNRIREKAILTK